MSTPTASAFQTRFRGSFVSLMAWTQLTEFWKVVDAKADAGWYVYALGEDVPDAPRSAPEFKRFLVEIDALLHRDHDEDYCGIVYTDDRTNPTFIKIFDPNNLGVSCGSSKNPPLPGWILSLEPPSELGSDRILPERRKRWWNALWG